MARSAHGCVGDFGVLIVSPTSEDVGHPAGILFHTIVSVPAASTWGIAVMTLLLLTAATILILQGRRLRSVGA